MKTLTISILAILFFLPGCYTVVWSPNMEFPKTEDYSSDQFYDDRYYGEYNSYYEIPWWFSIAPPPVYSSGGGGTTSGNKDGNRSQNSPRDNTSERRIQDRGADRPVQVAPPTRDTNSGSSTSSSGNSNSGNSSSRSGDSSSTNSSERNNRNSSDNERQSRNNDGSRSSGSGRR